MVIAIGTRAVKANDPAREFVSLRPKNFDHFSISGTQQRTAHCFRVKKNVLQFKKKLSLEDDKHS